MEQSAKQASENKPATCATQFSSIPRSELPALSAYVAERRLPVGAADVAAAAAPRAAATGADPAEEENEDSDEVRCAPLPLLNPYPNQSLTLLLLVAMPMDILPLPLFDPYHELSLTPT